MTQTLKKNMTSPTVTPKPVSESRSVIINEPPKTLTPPPPKKKPLKPVKFKNFKPIGAPKYQGFNLKNITNIIGRKGHQAFFSLQTVGGIGLAVSGYLSGNDGRMTTGALNTLRNFSGSAFEKGLGPLKKIDKDVGRGALMTAAVLSNLPQLITAITMPGITIAEIVAAAAAVSAYTILATPAWKKSIKLTKEKVKKITQNNNLFKGKTFCPKSVEVEKSIEIEEDNTLKKEKTLTSKFNTAAKKTLVFSTIYVAPALLFVRAGAQLLDGILRMDVAAIAAGSAFVIAPITLAIANRYQTKNQARRQDKATLKEMIKNYPPVPLRDKNNVHKS